MTDRDDLDDPGMADLMRRWGQEVRGASADEEFGRSGRAEEGVLFEPPTDFSAMYAALDGVDKEIETSTRRARVRTRRLSWPQRGLAIAAAVTLAAGGWFVAQRVAVQHERQRAVARLALREVGLSPRPERLRGGGPAKFHQGQQQYIQFTTDEPGFAVVAILDSEFSFTALGGPEVFTVEPGHNALPQPIRLKGKPGIESLVIVVTPEQIGREEFGEIISRAGATVPVSAGDGTRKGRGHTHEDRLAVITDTLRLDGRLAVDTFTFELLPE